MNSKRWYSLIGLLVALGMLVACGPQAAQPTPTTGPAPGGEATATAPAGGAEATPTTPAAEATPGAPGEAQGGIPGVLRVNWGSEPATIDPQKMSFVGEIAVGSVVYVEATLDARGRAVARRVELWVTPEGRVVGSGSVRLAGLVRARTADRLVVRIRNRSALSAVVDARTRVTGLRAALAEIQVQDVVLVEGELQQGRLVAHRIHVAATADGRLAGTVTAVRPARDGRLELLLDGAVLVSLDAGARVRTPDGRTVPAAALRVGQSVAATGALGLPAGPADLGAVATVEQVGILELVIR